MSFFVARTHHEAAAGSLLRRFFCLHGRFGTEGRGRSFAQKQA